MSERAGRSVAAAIGAGVLAVSVVLPGGGAVAAGGECTPTGFRPRSVVVGLSVVERTATVSTDCPAPAGWTAEVPDLGLSLSNLARTARFTPGSLDNDDAGAHDVTASATDGAAVTNEVPLTDGIVLKRRTSWRGVGASPEPAVKGEAITVTGKLVRASWESDAYAGYRGRQVQVQFKPVGGSYTTKKTVQTTTGGTVRTTVKASATGSWRLSYGGNDTSGPAVSAGDTVKVFPTSLTRVFANCPEMNRYYPHGVGRAGASDQVSGSSEPVTDFLVSTKLYNHNTGRDRDDDGIACEHL
jgi:hypothetical protein